MRGLLASASSSGGGPTLFPEVSERRRDVVGKVVLQSNSLHPQVLV